MSGGAFNGGPVSYTAGVDLAVSRRVKLNSSLALVYAGALEASIGITNEAAVSGDQCGVIPWGQAGTVEVTAAGAITAGATCYPAASGKVDDAQTGGGERFVALEAATADGDRVQMARLNAAAGMSELLLGSVTDSSAAGASSTAEAAFDLTKSLDGSALKAGDVLDIEALVKFPTTHATDTATCKLKFGGVTLLTSAATDVANSDVCLMRARVTVTVAGLSGFVKAHGDVSIGTPGSTGPSPKVNRVAATAQDLSGAVSVSASVQFSVSDAGNTAVLESLQVIHHKVG